jgi:hypothetical protein
MKFYELLKVFSEMDKEAHLFARHPDKEYYRMELFQGRVYLNFCDANGVWSRLETLSSQWLFTYGWEISEESKPCKEKV